MKRFRTTFSLLLCLLIALALPMAALAADNPTVDYTGQQNTFQFGDVGSGSTTDLFADFKDVLPGDTIAQKIDVKNSSTVTVKIYLRQEPVSEEHRAFLDQLRMTVFSDIGPTKLYEEAPSNQDGLANNVLLGTFLPGAKMTLTVNITVPDTLGNAIAGLQGSVSWVFTVEEVQVDPPPGPATGDMTSILPWLAIAAVMAAAIVLLVVLRKRAKGHE